MYTQGSLNELIALTGWKGSSVLYIGDSLFSDLVEPSRISGWRTGAIIRYVMPQERERAVQPYENPISSLFIVMTCRDLESELQIQSTPEYQQLVYQVSRRRNILTLIERLTFVP